MRRQRPAQKIAVFPELCITGYTCGDLFTQEVLLRDARKSLHRIAEYTKGKDALIFVGVPLAIDGELYNVAAALHRGEILGAYHQNLPAELRRIL